MTAGMIDLGATLRTLRVTRRPETYTFITLDTDAPALGDGVEAVISEAEGPTVVATLQRALAEGWPIGFTATWLTLDIHSALEAVGLTATVARALTRAAIPCNVIAAYHHDHLLVPADRADEAILVLEGVASEPDRSD